MNRKVMQRLMWKDARTIAALTIATLVAIVALNLLLILLSETRAIGLQRLTIAKVLWVLLPSLFAFGAPAMLIGGEEESGSLGWLRSLPAKWWVVAISKFAVASIALLVVWCLGTVGYQLQWMTSSEQVIAWFTQIHTSPEPFVDSIAIQFAYSITLLLVGLVTAYLFRSPINALLAVVPLMAGLILLYFNVQETFVQSVWDNSQSAGAEAWWASASLIVAGISLLFLVHLWCAKRRLAGPVSSLPSRIEEHLASDAFRPPQTVAGSWYGVTLVNLRPTKWRALLWRPRDKCHTPRSLRLPGATPGPPRRR